MARNRLPTPKELRKAADDLLFVAKFVAAGRPPDAPDETAEDFVAALAALRVNHDEYFTDPLKKDAGK